VVGVAVAVLVLVGVAVAIAVVAIAVAVGVTESRRSDMTHNADEFNQHVALLALELVGVEYSIEDRDGVATAVLDGWTADDGNCEVYYDWASSGREAAEAYVSDGDWGDIQTTTWVRVRVWRSGYAVVDGAAVAVRLDEATHSVELAPDQPDCGSGHDHDWMSPSFLGGLDERPGVWGHGGGVIVREVCAHCGAYRTTDTWAQDQTTGRQGLTSVSYEAAHDESVAWIGGDE